MKHFITIGLGVVFAVCTLHASADEPAKTDREAKVTTSGSVTTGGTSAQVIPDRETLFKQFEEKLSGSALVGSFTTTGMEGEPPKADRYVLEKVEHLKDDLWRFTARIQYDGRDMKIPLALEVKWAGDTPMISLTKMQVPGFGTFSARVLFYEDQYAGTWSGGDHGGQMYGRIEKLTPEEIEKLKEKPGDKKAKDEKKAEDK